jgi:DNA-binding MarR family transcriptional regulator
MNATVAQTKLSGCTNLKLRQLTRRVSQHYDSYTALAGLKTTQYSLLTAVDRLGPLPPGELARLMHLEPSTLTRNLKPLADAGWVVVGEGADARSRLVQITAEGHAKRAEAKRLWRQAQEALNAKLGPPRVAALHALLDDSLALFDETPEEDT